MTQNRRAKFGILFFILILWVNPATGLTQRRSKASKQTQYVPVTVYDPKRDAAKDIADAVAEAQRTGKHVLVEVGGDWCKWCHILDDFFTANEDLLALRDKNFVTVKVNFSEENHNEEVLSRYPEISGYPHIFFLDSKGKLLLSQDTGALENGRSYSLERLTTVLTNSGPK